MGFYEEISWYYDYIFPAGEEQLLFIEKAAEGGSKRILDIACGSGTYSVELAKGGHRVTAVDLDAEMVRRAKEKAESEGPGFEVYPCDMLNLAQKLPMDSFDLAFCIGNSLVHLENKKDIARALQGMRLILKEEGILLLQIINFDRVLKYSVSELPTLRNDEVGLEFVRKYELDAENGRIRFNTVLTVQEEGEQMSFSNSIGLVPLLSGELRAMLGKEGFRKIDFFGDFKGSPYSENSFLLVARAVK